MGFDPALLKQLLDVFKVELEEQLQIITDGLLQLEKTPVKEDKQKTCIETIFRAAHNIKGAARSLNINVVADIAHHIESLFSTLQKKVKSLSQSKANLCFEAVDKMRLGMQCFHENQPIAFDLDDLLNRLDQIDDDKPRITKPKPTPPPASPKIDQEPEHETIRVSIENLDRIAALMEEMQANKIAIDDHHEEFAVLAENMKHLMKLWQQTPSRKLGPEQLQKFTMSSEDSLTEMNQTMQKLNKNLSLRVNELSGLSYTLQEEVRMLRLIPASSLLQSLPRAVRDLANEMNKKVEIIISGDHVKMDKLVLEKLKNPIIHLLRNAIDHGIEEPSIRKANGKTEISHIWLDVVEEGNQILLNIKDDGAGIDIKKVTEVSEKKNIISKSDIKSMNEEDIIDLIFRPGFSTREIITEVSGRGVGLNIVKENIEQLKGQVSITTELGMGTTFHLRVPLTLAGERGLIVISGGQLFVIPSASIVKVLSLTEDAIVDVGASQAIILDSHPIPLRNLADILNLEKREPLSVERLSLVVIKKDRHNLALLVESIIGEREIVVKPLLPPLDNIKSIAGGTLSSSGQVMIVLNPSDILARTIHEGGADRVTVSNTKNKTNVKPHILIVDDSITTRTLEKGILESNGYQVTAAVDGKEAWDLLQKQKFSLLISDVVMPRVDGFTLTDRVKKSKELQHMPVIIVTSLGSETEKKRGIEVGADAYIIKNEFESGVLLEIVSQMV